MTVAGELSSIFQSETLSHGQALVTITKHLHTLTCAALQLLRHLLDEGRQTTRAAGQKVPEPLQSPQVVLKTHRTKPEVPFKPLRWFNLYSITFVGMFTRKQKKKWTKK